MRVLHYILRWLFRDVWLAVTLNTDEQAGRFNTEIFRALLAFTPTCSYKHLDPYNTAFSLIQDVAHFHQTPNLSSLALVPESLCHGPSSFLPPPGRGTTTNQADCVLMKFRMEPPKEVCIACQAFRAALKVFEAANIMIVKPTSVEAK